MLSLKMTADGIEVRQANADADTTIIRVVMEKAKCSCSTVVIGEDVDLLVLLIALAPKEREIKFFKAGKGNEESKTYSSKKLQELDFAKKGQVNNC